MEKIIYDYITIHFNKIVDGSILKNVNVELSENFENIYLYNISIKTENYKGDIFNFDDKLEIIYYPDYILYKNLHRGISQEPIINITLLADLGVNIKNYLLNLNKIIL
jgi:hypothetical protein